MTSARAVGVSLVAAALAGVLALGIGGRIAMRGIALFGGIDPGWSLAGTLEVLAAGGLYGLAGGVPYVLIRRWIPPRRWRGPAFGAMYLVLVVGHLNVARPDLARLAGSMWPIALAVFVPVFLLYGLTAEWIVARLARFEVSGASAAGAPPR